MFFLLFVPTFSDIRDQTQLVDKELIRTLQSLVDVRLITMPEVRFTEKIECKMLWHKPYTYQIHRTGHILYTF